jgi:hypothetical protein
MDHVVQYDLNYGTKDEYEFRFAIFKKNLADIEAINNDPNITHFVGINQFSTWTDDERKILTGYDINSGGQMLEGYRLKNDEMDLQHNL